jgi:uncharacterized protein YjiS (DUF1127 family)
MSHYFDGRSVAALSPGRAFSWRAFFYRIVETVKLWRRRQREREEFLFFLTTDHRAFNDLSVGRSDALEWAERPFWRE